MCRFSLGCKFTKLYSTYIYKKSPVCRSVLMTLSAIAYKFLLFTFFFSTLHYYSFFSSSAAGFLSSSMGAGPASMAIFLLPLSSAFFGAVRTRTPSCR